MNHENNEKEEGVCSFDSVTFPIAPLSATGLQKDGTTVFFPHNTAFYLVSLSE